MSDLNTRETLLKRIASTHDDESWDEFVYYYKEYLSMFLKGCSFDRNEIPDIVQLSLLKIWKNIGKFKYDKKRRFRSWLCELARNTAIDYYRKNQRMKDRDFLIQENLEMLEDGRFVDDEIEIMAEERWRNHLLNLALNNIRGVVSAKMFHVFMEAHSGKTALEISDEFKLPKNTVYVYIKRMQSKLKEQVSYLQENLDG